MTRILVIGKSGQMAQALASLNLPDFVCAGRERADLADAGSLERVLREIRPDVVINTGAFTNVDGAESEPEAARAMNVTGPASLAGACAAEGVALVHLSTDCVFDGTKDEAYTPQDAPQPLGVYGQTKLDGEHEVLAASPCVLVVRVSWIFSRFGNNFVRTMLRLAGTRDEVAVVSDQIGCPTHAPALAEGLVRIAQQAAAPGFDQWGTFHLAGAGEINRAGMAERILETSRRHGGPSAAVRRVLTADFPTPAERPLNARLDSSETTRVFGVALPDWQEGVEVTVPALLKEIMSQ
ncbi:MAG: hypothetical protein VR75_00380 [Hyphomonadaceae bacterium BRH_c29]|nr:MAG: hypothetical protein VR75_00380 [Hyphomonadaceae bacterium BRH_c29]